jgi:hypothetical protein
MLVFSFLFLIAAILLLTRRRSTASPNSSRLYRLDNRVMASALIVLAISFAVLAWATGKYLP